MVSLGNNVSKLFVGSKFVRIPSPKVTDGVLKCNAIIGSKSPNGTELTISKYAKDYVDYFFNIAKQENNGTLAKVNPDLYKAYYMPCNV